MNLVIKLLIIIICMIGLRVFLDRMIILGGFKIEETTLKLFHVFVLCPLFMYSTRLYKWLEK
jgi:hypothetical protein